MDKHRVFHEKTALKIYLIEHDDNGHDITCEFVIAATNTKQVRELASNAAAMEGPEIWQTAKIKKLGYFCGKQKTPHIVVNHFRPG
jgi:hypothetical protein